MAFGPFRDLHALGEAVAADVFAVQPPPVAGKPGDLANVVAAAIEQNFAAEAALDQEVEAQLSKLGSQTAGMDSRKLREGLRARLAKEKGLVL